MQISDVLYHKQTSESISSPIDPTYYNDLKAHLNNNLEYRKARIEWRKTKPISWDMFRIKEEFFQMYCENDLPVFHNDVELFVKNHPELSVEDGAKMFCEKFRGYQMTYSVEFVERAIRRCKHEL